MEKMKLDWTIFIVLRMVRNRDCMVIMEWQLEEKRKVGKPKIAWRRTMEKKADRTGRSAGQSQGHGTRQILCIWSGTWPAIFSYSLSQVKDSSSQVHYPCLLCLWVQSTTSHPLLFMHLQVCWYFASYCSIKLFSFLGIFMIANWVAGLGFLLHLWNLS